jgi:hypothetical protein
MLKKHAGASRVNDFIDLIKYFYEQNIPFEKMPESSKERIGCFLISSEEISSVSQFVALFHYFSTIRLHKHVLESYGWNKKIFPFLKKNIEAFSCLNLSNHLFDLAYLGFVWEDLVENELDLIVLTRLKELSPSLQDLSVLMQALEYLGAYRHPSLALDDVLHNLLKGIKKEFNLFVRDSNLTNVLYVLHRNLFKLELDKYFSKKKCFMIKEFGETSCELRLNRYIRAISSDILSWLKYNQIPAQGNVRIPGSGFSATIWLPKERLIVFISTGKAYDDRYREKKKSILKSLGYENFVVIDANEWKALLTDEERNSFYSKSFDMLDMKKYRTKEITINFSNVVKEGKKFSDVVKVSGLVKNKDGKECSLVSRLKTSVMDAWSQDCQLYKSIWGMDKYFFKTNKEIESEYTFAIDRKAIKHCKYKH